MKETTVRLKAFEAQKQQHQTDLLRVEEDKAALINEIMAEEEAMQQQEEAWKAEEAAANVALEKRRNWLAKNRGVLRQRRLTIADQTSGIKREASFDTDLVAKVARSSSMDSVTHDISVPEVGSSLAINVQRTDSVPDVDVCESIVEESGDG